MSIKIKHWSDKITMQTVYEFKIPAVQTVVTDEMLYYHPEPKELLKHQVLKYIGTMIDEAFDKAEELKWTAAESVTVNFEGKPINLAPGDSVEVSFDKGEWNAGGYISPEATKILMGVDPAQSTEGQVTEILSVFPGLKEKVVCPSNCPGDVQRSVKEIIIHLNDHHKWTREKIADWLETLDININMEEEDANN